MPATTAAPKKKRPAKKAPEVAFSNAPTDDTAAAPAPEKVATKKKAPAKKKPASKSAPATKADSTKAPATKTKKAPAKKTAPAKKVAATKATEVTPKTTVKKRAKKTSNAVGGQGLPRDLNEHGFVIGSDSAKIAEVMLEGGASRTDINERVAKALGKKKTRNGNQPNVSSLVANVLRRLKDKGYYVEETWVLKPATPATKAKATKAAKARQNATGDTEVVAQNGSTTGKARKVAKKKPAKKSKG